MSHEEAKKLTIEEALALELAPTTEGCKVCDTVPAEVVAAVRAAHREQGLPIAGVQRALAAAGYRIGETTVRRHLRNGH